MKNLIAVLVFLPFVLCGATYYVNGTKGNDSNTGLSASAAKKTIQSAIDAAGDGSIIRVSSGTYQENLSIAHPVTLLADATFQVLIDGQARNHCIDIAVGADGFTLDGFVLLNGRATNGGNTYGGGVDCYSAGAIKNCIFKNNGNSAQYFSGGLEIRCEAQNVNVENCLFVGNVVRCSGGGVLCEGTATFDHCTIWGNTCSGWNQIGGLAVASGGNATIKNSIIWNNRTAEIGSFSGGSSGTVTITYSCVEGGYSGTGNISSNPAFVETEADFSLQDSSPCRSSGDDGGNMGFHKTISATVEHTVTFNANGGTTATESQCVEDGAVVGDLPMATWDGHEFLGWFTAAVGGTEVSAETRVTSDIVLYAHWQKAGVAPDTSEDFCSEWTSAGTIDLSTGERRVSEAQAVSYGATWFENGAKAVVKVDGVSFVEKAGTGFVSWTGIEKKRYTLTHQVFNAGGVQVGDTYTATFQWVNQISVAFMGNLSGVDDQTLTYDEGSVYGTFPEVACQNYEFLGWWTSASGGQQVATNDIVLAATTLYAHWRSTYIACTPKVEMTPVVVTVPSGASIKVSGLPSGLKFTAKALTVKATRTSLEKKYSANTIYGTPSRSGVYAATVTTTVGTGKSAVSTSTIKKFVVRTDSESMIDAEWDPSDGKVTGMAVGSVGKKVTLKAVANRGFVFAGWYCDSDFTLPMSGAADYRSTSQTLQIEKDDVTYYARFVPASEDGTLVARIGDEYSLNGPWTLKLDIDSLSLPTVTVKGLPTGLKFDAKTLTVSGTPTKPGSYTVTLSLKNTTVKKAVTQTFKINVSNIESPYLTGISYATDAYNYRGGVAVGWDIGSCATDGYAVSSVSGLPAGLKFNVKTGKIEGVPTKAGTFTATITLKNGKMSSIATVTLNVQAIDTWAYGTFNGGSDDGQVQLTITSAGKLSGKYLSDGLTYALASSSFSHYANGVYQADVKASWSYKDGRNTVKKTDVWPLVVEADVVGGRATNDVFSAWQNVWSQKDWKAFGTSYFGQSGTTQTLVGSDYGLADGESIVMKVRSNGSVTLKGVFATEAQKNGKTVYYTVTGSAVVCVQSSDPFVGEVFIYFPPNATKKFNGYVRVVSIGE